MSAVLGFPRVQEALSLIKWGMPLGNVEKLLVAGLRQYCDKQIALHYVMPMHVWLYVRVRSLESILVCNK